MRTGPWGSHQAAADSGSCAMPRTRPAMATRGAQCGRVRPSQSLTASTIEPMSSGKDRDGRQQPWPHREMLVDQLGGLIVREAFEGLGDRAHVQHRVGDLGEEQRCCDGDSRGHAAGACQVEADHQAGEPGEHHEHPHEQDQGDRDGQPRSVMAQGLPACGIGPRPRWSPDRAGDTGGWYDDRRGTSLRRDGDCGCLNR